MKNLSKCCSCSLLRSIGCPPHPPPHYQPQEITNQNITGWKKENMWLSGWIVLAHYLKPFDTTWSKLQNGTLQNMDLSLHQCCILNIAERAPKCLFLLHQLGSLEGWNGVLSSKNCCQDTPLTFQPAFTHNSLIQDWKGGAILWPKYCGSNSTFPLYYLFTYFSLSLSLSLTIYLSIYNFFLCPIGVCIQCLQPVCSCLFADSLCEVLDN